jgi:hypothetical protein
MYATIEINATNVTNEKKRVAILPLWFMAAGYRLLHAGARPGEPWLKNDHS